MAFHISLLFILTTIPYTITMGCVNRERLGLLDFKKSFPLSFPRNNGKLSSWNSSEVARNCCGWEGITCDYNTGHVVSLDLYQQYLESYQLRPSLLQLQHLRSLNLVYNNLAMRIPKFIGSFGELTSLDLSAGFFGTIPPQIGNLSKLQNLGLGGNIFSIDNLQWLSHLSALQSLDMSFLNLSEVRDWVSVIRKLPILSDFSCEYCYFPTRDLSSTALWHVNSSSTLQKLSLSGSQLSASSLSYLLANSTGNLSNLSLDSLELDAPFPNIFHDNIMSVQNLVLSNTSYFEDGIFNSIGNLCNLSYLDAYGSTINQSLPNIIQALSGCASSSLEHLQLSSTNLTGEIPSILKFTSLQLLDLSSNGLENFPPQNNSLLTSTPSFFPASLSNLYLSNNNLNGILKDVHFTNLSNLEYLVLSSNPNLTVSFNTTLPRAIYVDMSSCNLGPSFPSWLLSLTSSPWLIDISDCKISGRIPIMFWMNLSPHLNYLNLSSNSFYGEIPNMQFQFSNYETIVDLSFNALSGEIPFFLFTANELYLSKNNFSGFSPITYHYNSSNSPSMSYGSIFNSELTSVVDLSNNLLSGSIPYWLGFIIPNLGALFLTNNNLSGTIPSSIGIARRLHVLSLRNNRFSGSIPPLLKNYSELRILDLVGNRFSKTIPSWIGENLKNLSLLSLKSNKLSGILPTSLCQLHSLQILDLSHNLLSENIPSCVQNFTAMAHHFNSSLRVAYPLKDGTIDGLPLEEAAYFNA